MTLPPQKADTGAAKSKAEHPNLGIKVSWFGGQYGFKKVFGSGFRVALGFGGLGFSASAQNRRGRNTSVLQGLLSGLQREGI